MGILLWKHGIGPAKEKVRAVKEATRPSSASEVRSFLGLVGFSSRFIPDFATKAEPYEYSVERMRSSYGVRHKRRLSIR